MTWAERYATNPEFRAKEIARSRLKAKTRQADPVQRDKQNAWRRRKYRDNHPYRERTIKKAVEWEQAHKAHKKNYYLQRSYGITIQQYEALLEQQGGVCLLCGKPPKGGKRQMAVDHDHSTGRVRAILHIRCNSVLSHCFGDDTEQMRAAADRFINGGLRS